jgi:hypothetical protein
LRDTGQAAPTVIAARAEAQTAAAAPAQGEPPKPGRYLRGVR